MVLLIYFIFGVVFGGLAVWFLIGKGMSEKGERLIEKQAREKKENQRRILEFFESQTQVANSDIKKLLGVSDATATRYLEELEKEGKVKQVGKTGRFVYYEKS